MLIVVIALAAASCSTPKHAEVGHTYIVSSTNENALVWDIKPPPDDAPIQDNYISTNLVNEFMNEEFCATNTVATNSATNRETEFRISLTTTNDAHCAETNEYNAIMRPTLSTHKMTLAEIISIVWLMAICSSPILACLVWGRAPKKIKKGRR